MLQDKLGLACERHTEITGYTIGAQTHTNPTSTNNFAYLTGRNFGLTHSRHPLVGNRRYPVGCGIGIVRRAIDDDEFVDSVICERADVVDLQVAQGHGQPKFGGVASAFPAQPLEEIDPFGGFPHTVEIETVPAVAPRDD